MRWTERASCHLVLVEIPSCGGSSSTLMLPLCEIPCFSRASMKNDSDLFPQQPEWIALYFSLCNPHSARHQTNAHAESGFPGERERSSQQTLQGRWLGGKGNKLKKNKKAFTSLNALSFFLPHFHLGGNFPRLPEAGRNGSPRERHHVSFTGN